MFRLTTLKMLVLIIIKMVEARGGRFRYLGYGIED